MLDEIRQKPRRVRERYAFLAALSATSVIAAVWLVATFVHWSDSGLLAEPEEGQAAGGAFSQFFDELKGNISDAWPADNAGENESTAATATDSQAPVASSSAGRSATSTAAQEAARPVLIATSSSIGR